MASSKPTKRRPPAKALRRTPRRAPAAAEAAPPAANGEDPNQGLEYAQCRSLGHGWRHSGKTVGDPSTGSVGFVSRCPECGTSRTKWITRSGVLGAMSYDHPKNYSRSGDNRLSTREWRATFLVTVFGD